MISRVYIKNYLSFDEVELNFAPGLSVFSGVSGAGKSVLMGAILAVLGYKDSEAKLIEADIDAKLDMSEFGIIGDEINTFKVIKDKSVRYFINNQSISKKNLLSIASSHLKYLSAKNISEFANDRLLGVIDFLIDDSHFAETMNKFRIKFNEFIDVQKELDKISDDEKKLNDLKEFASFEIGKISDINPKIGEFEELLLIKKRLSKKDKIQEAWVKADLIFNYEKAVLDALNLSDVDSSFFSDAINELRLARNSVSFDDLEDVDIEGVLDRIESLNSLIKRYGSIQEALEVLQKRQAELDRYNKIEFEKNELKQRYDSLNKEVTDLANKISNMRKNVLGKFSEYINNYLAELYMPAVSIELSKKSLDYLGFDEVSVSLNSANLKNLSSGEINRLRLAFIATEVNITKFGSGVLILDEIDANLSGKEAMSIANVLLELAKYYQIFAISHQPQLSSKANSHFVVQKDINNISSVKLLNKEERVKELSRMISGKIISDQAVEFAKKLLND